MNALDSLRTGDLQQALAELQDSVRQDPSNSKYRVFLFQLLAVTGQWDRAATQLGVCGEMDPGTLAMVQAYREALSCEILRAQIFAGKKSPLVFGEPESWIAWLVEALRSDGPESYEQSQQLRAKAFDEATATCGRIVTVAHDAADDHEDQEPAGDSFAWIADGDSRLGPILETLVDGRYYWVPFHRIRQIDVDPPEDLRDFVWMPAHFVWANGGETMGFIPTRYPGSESSPDDQIRLARKTEWNSPSEGVYHGLGQRMLATDNGEYSLLDIRKIVLETPSVPSEVEADDVTPAAGD